MAQVEDQRHLSLSAEIAAAIRRARRQLNLTQGDVATFAGTPRAQVNRIERGEATDYLARLVRILDVCGLELRVVPRTARLGVADERPAGSREPS